MPFIPTKIHGYKVKNAYNIKFMQTKIQERIIVYGDKGNGSGDKRYRGRPGY